MAQKIVDISKFLNNDAPQMVLFGKTYTVKNDKTTILLLNQLQGKVKKGEEETLDEKIYKLLLGETAGAEIVETLNNNANYVENNMAVMCNVMALATGREYEDVLKQAQNNMPS